MKRFLATAALLGLAACSNAPQAGTAFERGRAAFAAGDARTARVELLNAIKERPNDPAVRLLQAQVHLELGDGIAAQAEVERARMLGRPVSETAHLLAHALLLQGEHRRAAEEAAKAAPAHAAYAGRIRGLAFAAMGDNDAAAAEFARAFAAGPDDHRLWLAYARFRRDNGDLAGALGSADRAVALKREDVEAITLRGELTRSQYGLRAALPWFDRALEIDPRNVTALLERAATYGDMGEARAMLADTRQALSASPDNARAFFLQAMLAARAGKFDLAQSLYQRTRGRVNGQPSAMLLASAIAFQTGNAEQAIGRLTKLLELQPDNRKARKLLAASHWRLGDARATVDALAPLADRPDADAYILSLMGKALAAQGRRDVAAIYLARAAQPQQRSATALAQAPLTPEELDRLRYLAQTRPDDPQAQVRLIGGLLSSGLGDEALLRARSLQADNPGVPDAHILVGDALGTRGDFAGAAREYRRAANLAFNEPVAMRMIEALERSGQPEAAAQVLELFLEQNPRSVNAQLLAANAYMRAGDWPAAIRTYETLRRQIGDRDAIMLNNLAWAYSERGALDRALPLAERAWQLDKNNPATADTLGWLLFKSGKDRARGLALLEQAARGAPTDEEVRRRLSFAHRG